MALGDITSACVPDLRATPEDVRARVSFGGSPLSAHHGLGASISGTKGNGCNGCGEGLAADRLAINGG